MTSKEMNSNEKSLAGADQVYMYLGMGICLPLSTCIAYRGLVSTPLVPWYTKTPWPCDLLIPSPTGAKRSTFHHGRD